MATDKAVEWDQTVTCLRGYIYKEKERKFIIFYIFGAESSIVMSQMISWYSTTL